MLHSKEDAGVSSPVGHVASAGASGSAQSAAGDPPATKDDERLGEWTWRSGYALAFLTLIYAFNTADRNVFGLLMPLMKADLKLSDTTLGLMSGFAFSCFYAIAGLPVAYLSDRWSRRNIIAIGFAVWSLMTVLTGFARNAVHLAAARFMLGAGEAGGLAPSTSMISDLFGKRRRTVALSMMQSANSLGIFVAFPVIGWVAAQHGWRYAYVVAGLPGFLLAIVFFLTVREPRRGHVDGEVRAPGGLAGDGFIATIRRLLASRKYVLAMAASTLVGVSLSGVQTWLPAFLMRVHHLHPGEVGAYIGALRGPAGIAGALSGGLVTNWFARRDERWLAWTPALFMLMIAASDILLLTSSSGWGWKAGTALDTFFSSAQVGPVFGLLLAGADSRTRAMATAVTMLFLNLFGLAGGPLLVGALNDVLHPAFGDVAIRYSMLAAAAGSVLAALLCASIEGRRPAQKRA